MLNNFENFQDQFEDFVTNNGFPTIPKQLYEPLDYIISIGGKRLRPISLMLSEQLFRAPSKDAISAAFAIELFHNFSLIHDDIMDEAPLRRGKQTVHELWDTNTAILSGDAMLIYSYKYLTEACSKSNSQAIHRKFSSTAIAVCEGQQMDVNFESMDLVEQADYIEMIYKKTGALLEGAMTIGAILGGANSKDVELVGQFAKNIGISFQLQDDLLDLYGDQSLVGKQVGGDVIQCKKTILYILALKLAGDKSGAIIALYKSSLPENEKVEKVRTEFDHLGVREAAEKLSNMYHDRAFSYLDELKIDVERKMPLTTFVKKLVKREF